MTDTLYTVKEAAEAMRVSVSTLYRLFQANEIPLVKVRGRTFVKKDSVSAFLDQNHLKN